MKRFMILAIAASLVAGASMATPAQAKKKKKPPPPAPRIVEFEYICPCPGFIQLGTLGTAGNLGGGAVPVGAGEIYLTAVVNDSSGGVVPVNLNQANETGGNMAVPGGRFCGATEEPVLLEEGREIRVFVGNMIWGGPTTAPEVDPCPAPATGGTITITLSTTPIAPAPATP